MKKSFVLKTSGFPRYIVGVLNDQGVLVVRVVRVDQDNRDILLVLEVLVIRINLGLLKHLELFSRSGEDTEVVVEEEEDTGLDCEMHSK